MAEKVSSPRFSNYPLFWLAICFAFGILGAKYAAVGMEASITACTLSGIIAAVFARREFSLIFVFIAFASAGSATYLLREGNSAAERIKTIYDTQKLLSGEPVEIAGTMIGNREDALDGFFITVEIDRIVHNKTEFETSGRVRLFAPVQSVEAADEYDSMGLQSGAMVRIACEPVREDNFQNPGVLSRKELLDLQDIDATATLKSPLLVEVVQGASGWKPLHAIYSLRQDLIEEFRTKFSAPTAGVLIASLFGNKHFLDKNSAEVFREGGTFHILVISGLHITFIGGLGILIAGFFTKKKLVQFVAVTSFLWLYTLAVGAEIPVVRASLMFTILFFSQVIYRNGTLVNALGACTLVLLAWRPQDLFGPSFQLTFVSVAAIVIIGFPLIEKLRSVGDWTPTIKAPFPPLVPVWIKRSCETLYWRETAWRIESDRNVWSANLFKSPYRRMLGLEFLQRCLAFVFEGIVISIVVQLCLLPFLVVYFHRVSPVSVLLNLWAGVFIALESFSSLVAIFFSPISGALAFPFIQLTEFFNWLLIALPALFVQFDWASFRLPVYTGWYRSIYAAYLIPIIVIGYATYKWDPFALPIKLSRRRVGAKTIYAAVGFTILAGMVIIFHPFSTPGPDGRLHVEFLDVGQGDAAFITFPNGETMLIDGGGRTGYKNKRTDEDAETVPFEPDVPGIGEAVVSEFLWEKGYSEIGYIVATHADADHMQGLVDVANNFKIGTALTGRTPANDPDFAEFAKMLERRGIKTATIARGDVLAFGEVKVEVLYPEAANDPAAVSDNDHSVVLRIVMGSRAFLLTGDIETRAESEITAGGSVLAADVVKVPHHGSRTSSTQAFVNAAGARYAVISVGRSSVFGHPHKEVVERWRAGGAVVLTTGERGTISVSTNGEDLEIGDFLFGRQ